VSYLSFGQSKHIVHQKTRAHYLISIQPEIKATSNTRLATYSECKQLWRGCICQKCASSPATASV